MCNKGQLFKTFKFFVEVFMHVILETRRIDRKIRNVLLTLLIILMLTTSLASAASDGTKVYVTRLTGTYVGIKIIFPNEISGSFGGMIGGNYFNCATIPSNTLYCIGQLASWVKVATLYIYEKPAGDVIFTTIISAPPGIGKTNVVPTPPPPPNQECPPEECPQ